MLLLPECLPFSIALAVTAGLALLEGLGLVLGAGVGHALDSVFGDLPALDHLFGWLHVRKLPALVVLICAFTCFGLSGLGVQRAALELLGHLLSPLSASGIALISSLPLLHLTLKGVARVVPGDETSAVARTSFVGRVGLMLQADASKDAPAQAKLQDSFGQTHYVLVEPEDDGQTLIAGEEILIVRQHGARFTAIRNTHSALSKHRGSSSR
ncbi:MAG: OB-fold-containig protein [Polyangiales bacterium]